MKITKKILKILAWIILIFIVFYIIFMIIQKMIWKDETPNFMGYKNFIVLTGSMEPALNRGDIIIVKETKNIQKDDIISYKVQNTVVTHRVVKIKKENNKQYYITKGDANSGLDNEVINASNIEGKYLFKIPLIGYGILFFQTSLGTTILICLLIISLLINSKINKEKK